MTVYPQPKEYLNELSRAIFGPLKNRDCSTSFFVPGGGKRTLVKFLLKEKSLIKSLLGNKFSKTIFVYVDPDELIEVSNEAYLSLILKQLVGGMKHHNLQITTKSNSTEVIDSIKKLLTSITQKNDNVVLILNDFEITLTLSQSIFLNLETFMSVNKSKIAYLFLSSVNMLAPDVLPKLHNLKYALTQNIFYVPLLERKEVLYMLQRIKEKLGAKFSPEIEDVILTVCGGHPQLVKYAAYALASTGSNFLTDVQKAKEFLLSHSQLKMVCSDIWHSLHSDEQAILTHVVKTKTLPETQFSLDFLLKTGLLNRTDPNQYSLFSQVFYDFIYSKIPRDKLYYDEKTNQIFFGLHSYSNLFTLQEFKVIVHLLRKNGALVSRDEIANVLWGEEAVDKYSDWTIDKTISTIRKKLLRIGFSLSKLATLKKRGFTLSQ